MALLVSVKDNQGEKQNVIKKYLSFNDRDEDTDEDQPKASGKKPSFVK